MKLKDIFKPRERVITQEIGAPGTQLFSGFISEEFNPDLRGREGTRIFDQMRKNDAQVFAALQAVKLPLLSARWFIKPAELTDDEDLAQEQADFIEGILMDQLKWKKQLRLILTYLDFGFKYLEKVFGMDDEGRVIWKKWGDRQQTAHSKWEDDSGNRGAEQQLPNLDSGDSEPFIPMDKLLLFSYQREGDNYEGVSLLRSSYKHWYYKDTLYRIQGISAERYGVGTPWVQLGDNSSNDDRERGEELAKNFRSNETNYLVTPGNPDGGGMNFKIITPEGDPKAAAIHDAVNHHNRMILMSVLAPFLDLGSDSIGSFALSKDQSSFFILSLQAIADDIKEIVNGAIEELVLINWPETKEFPKLEVTDLGDIDEEKFAMSLNTLAVAGLLDIDDNLKKYIRDILRLPELSEDFEEEMPEEMPEEIPELVPEEVEEEFEGRERVVLSTIKDREGAFLSAIDRNERIISDNLALFEQELVKTEKQLKVFLSKKLDNADTKDVNGVKTIKRNFRLVNEMKSGINDIMKKFQRKISGGALSAKMMKEVAREAILTTKTLDKSRELAASLIIAEPQIRSFMAGHISNLDAVTFNEGRRIFENVHDNITQEVSLRLAKEQVSKIKFNRNIYNLSVTAHPRGLFRSVITSDAQSQGIKHFKVVVPPSRLKDVLPAGITAGLLFTILTAQQFNERTGVKNNVNSAGGLGSHHNSFEYLYPIDVDRFSEEEELAKEQRSEFLKE